METITKKRTKNTTSVFGDDLLVFCHPFWIGVVSALATWNNIIAHNNNVPDAVVAAVPSTNQFE